MNNPRILRTTVAGIFILLLIGLDVKATLAIFPDWYQATLLVLLLGTTTLLAIIFHLRCTECKGCMQKYQKGLSFFYLSFAGIGLLSTFYIMLPEIITNQTIGKLVLTLAHAIVIGLGSPLAFRSLTGIEVSAEPIPPPIANSDNDDTGSPTPPALQTETYESLVEANLLPEEENLVESSCDVIPMEPLSKAALIELKTMEKLSTEKKTAHKETKREQYESHELRQAARGRQRALEERRKYQRKEAKL